MNGKLIKVMIADDNDEFLHSAEQFINSEAGRTMKVIKIAHNGLEAIKFYAKYEPDVILMDVDMPIMNGFFATEIIKDFSNSPKIIIISVFDSLSHIHRARKAGAEGFVSKANFGEEIIPMIQMLCRNDQEV